MNHSYNFDPVRLAEDTSNAYSAGCYTSWTSCARVLAKRGFNVFEAEAILRSKITRWARDMWNKPGTPTSGALEAYLDKYNVVPGCKEVNDLVMGTFDGSCEDIGCPNLHLERNDKGIPCRRGTMPGNPNGGTILVPLGTPLCCDPTSETYWSM